MYQPSACWILFLTLQPRQANKTLVFPFLFPSTLPSKSGILGDSSTLSFSMDVSPRDPIAVAWGWMVRQACSRKASLMCSSQRRWRWAYRVLLGDLPVFTSVNKLTCSPWVSGIPSGTPEFFCLTPCRVLRLPWAGLFSVWVSFKRGREICGLLDTHWHFPEMELEAFVLFRLVLLLLESKNRQVATHGNEEALSSFWLSVPFFLAVPKLGF